VSINPWSSLRGLPAEIWVLFTATLINRAGTMALPFLALYLTGRLGVSAGRAGLALAAYGVGALITAPLAGRLCDRIGAARVIKGSLFLSGALILLLPALDSFAAIVALVFAWAVAAEAFRPAMLAVITDFVPPHQRRSAFVVSRIAVNLGLSIGPAVGGFLAMVSFPILFFVDGTTSLLAFAVVALYRWRPPASAAREEDDGPAAAAATGASRWIPDRRYLYFLLAILPCLVAFFQIMAPMPIHLVRNLHMPESSYGILISINTLLIILVEVPINSAVSGWPQRRSLALGSLLVGAGIGGFALANGFAGMAAAVVIWTMGEMLFIPSSAACATELAPAGRQGEYMGLYTMTFSFAFGIGPLIGSMVLERLGPTTLWSGAFLLGCLSAVLVSKVRTGITPA
jgi:predicted MFS family arabinose efflux permease